MYFISKEVLTLHMYLCKHLTTKCNSTTISFINYVLPFLVRNSTMALKYQMYSEGLMSHF